MSAIAHMLLNDGYIVCGSDRSSSPRTEKMAKAGIKVFIGHNPENITEDIDLLVYTAAISDDNPEIKRAKELGVSCIDRAEMLGIIMKDYECPIAVSGTHGKTTTTGMLSQIFVESGKNPTINIGGDLDIIR